MKNLSLAIVLLCLALVPSAAQEAPTMGWSSWNTYGVNINETLIKRQADAMVSKGLKAVGFNHINIDDGYFGGRDAETGQLKIHPTRFPKGLQGVVDHIHKRGLRAGIYSDAGRNTCGSMFSGDAIGKGVGLYEHDQQDADFFFKELGFDFIKVDFCGGSYYHNEDHLVLDEQERYTAIAQAIRNTGRTDVRMNACRWAYPGTWISDVACSWRTTGDIYDGWESVKGIIQENLYLSAYCHDGHFNDMDMLEVGRSLTTEEDKTHFGMWCIMSSPLLIGCDITNIKTTTLNLLKNKELIALNQDSLFLQAYVVGLDNGCHIIVKDIEQLQGLRRAFAVYNPNDDAREVTVNFADLDLGGEVLLRDIFAKRDLGTFTDTWTVQVPAHGTRICVAQAETRLERTRYEAETAYISDYQEIKNNQSERTGIYESADYCSAGYKAGWLGYSEQNDLQWRDVFSQEGGEYKLTIAFIAGDSRKMTISVNGERVQTLTASSGGWQKVGKKTVTIQLQKGCNTIRLSNPTAWMPDIDYITLQRVGPGAAIHDVNPRKPATSAVYDLNGRPLPNPSAAKGLHITGGRKGIQTRD
ncbi:MAG: alpha-galactosidase [Bacteroidaceae bacterium]|nr:alpha-galactosidase [Bacteroidaceae bacterium]